MTMIIKDNVTHREIRNVFIYDIYTNVPVNIHILAYR